MTPRTKRPSVQTIFHLRIELADVTPTIWRRVLVPGNVRMSALSEMLLAAMGWTNSHLHAFEIGGERYGMCFDDYPEGEIDEAGVTVLEALGEDRNFLYEYDFGDSWDHDVVVEARTGSSLSLKFAVCIDGQNACPPEDVGGPSGYEGFLRAMADPDDEEHEDYLEWAGGPFDPAAFDLAAANVALQQIR